MVKLLRGKSPLLSLNYSNCEVYCVFTNLSLYFKYEMWGVFCDGEKHFEGEGKEKLKNGELGAGACPCLYYLTSYIGAWIAGLGFL